HGDIASRAEDWRVPGGAALGLDLTMPTGSRAADAIERPQAAVALLRGRTHRDHYDAGVVDHLRPARIARAPDGPGFVVAAAFTASDDRRTATAGTALRPATRCAAGDRRLARRFAAATVATGHPRALTAAALGGAVGGSLGGTGGNHA